MNRYILKICGKVQGVFYRKNTLKNAQQLGLKGYVMNLPDGRVEVDAEGNSEGLQQLYEWCKHGPEGARVDDIEKVLAEPIGYDDFVIRL